MNWIKKNWYVIFGGLAVVIAFFILVLHNNSGNVFWIIIVQSLYNALSLILLEGGNFAFPYHASFTVKVILWICYFAAPIITLAFIFEYIHERFLNFIPKALKNHIVICGLGRNGKIIYDLASKKYPNKRIVIIEKDETNSYGDKLEKDPKTWWLKKDFTELPVLQRAGISKAAMIYITTNNDLANITALMNSVNESSIGSKTYCHIGDIRLYTNMEKVVKKATNFSKVRLFNGYEIVTERLFENKVEGIINSKNQGNVYVFFGFGRFGQMLYNYIIKNKFNNEKDHIIIVTFDKFLLKDPRNYTWTNTTPENISKLDTHFGDMNDYSIWDKISNSIKDKNTNVNIFACRDSDIANINLAISLMNRGPENLKQGVVFCRTYSDTPDELQQILKQNIIENNKDDIILFHVYEELQEAFDSKLFQD